uniref:Uncharacterized protein n=1 Tax=Octopus bimaculoides TaxID=37653 RepID=A0A0L8I764_OCTBM
MRIHRQLRGYLIQQNISQNIDRKWGCGVGGMGGGEEAKNSKWSLYASIQMFTVDINNKININKYQLFLGVV